MMKSRALRPRPALPLLLSLLALFAPVRAGAQEDDLGAKLTGLWEGYISTELRGQRQRDTVAVEFGGNGTLTFFSRTGKAATYTVSADSVLISFADSPGEPLRLKDVEAERDSLKAKLKYPSDPPEAKSELHLKRVRDDARARVMSTKTAPCGAPDTPDALRQLLLKYQLDCPIAFTRETIWYKQHLIEKFLHEAIATLGVKPGLNYVPPDAKMRQDYIAPDMKLRLIKVSNVYFTLLGDESPFQGYVGSFAVIVQDVASKAKLDKDLVPFFAPMSIQVVAEEIVCPRGICPPLFERKSRFSGQAGELKSNLVRDGRVDFSRAWSAASNAAERVRDLRLNPNTEKVEGNNRSIKSISRKVPVNDPGYVVWEDVTIQMEDEYANTGRSGEAVRFTVISDLCRRSIGATRCAPITVTNGAYASTNGGVSVSDLEHPAIKAIIEAIKR